MKIITTAPFPQTGLVRPAQVRRYLGLPKNTFYRWMKDGRLPVPQPWGGTSVWDAQVIRKFVEELHGPAADSRTVIRH